MISLTCTDLYVSPVHINASVGSTAVFQCRVYDVYGTFESFSIFWLVHNSTTGNVTGYNVSVQDMEGGITIDGDICIHAYNICYSYLSIPASEINNNTGVQCQASFNIYPEDLQNSSVATLYVQGN